MTRRRRARQMLNSKDMPSGNPDLGRLSRINERLDDHQRRLDDHEIRITVTEREQREAQRDVAMLADIVMRARRRAASIRIRRRSKRRR